MAGFWQVAVMERVGFKNQQRRRRECEAGAAALRSQTVSFAFHTKGGGQNDVHFKGKLALRLISRQTPPPHTHTHPQTSALQHCSVLLLR